MSKPDVNKIPQSEYYRAGDNLHGHLHHRYPTLEAARKQREIFISDAMERLAGSSLTPEEAQTLAEDWYWVCDDNGKIID